MRGLAMLLVVLCHTMTGCTTGSEESFLFNVVWSLQMPLFILISGYVTRYSRSINTGVELWLFIKRRTLAYMLPWVVWSFLVRGVVFGQYNLLNIKWLLWHMDSGYWFLVTIWTISIAFGLSSFIALKIAKNQGIKLQVIKTVLYLVAMTLLAGIGYVAGMTFFAIKLTLYYMPFFFIGYLYGQYSEKLYETKYGSNIKDVVVMICLATWLVIITRVYLFCLSDSGMGIVLRVISSMSGCIAVCGLCKGIYEKIGGDKFYSLGVEQCMQTGRLSMSILHWAGKKSLEIYMIHGLLLNILMPGVKPYFSSPSGYGYVFANFIITLILCALFISLLSKNRYVKRILGMK